MSEFSLQALSLSTLWLNQEILFWMIANIYMKVLCVCIYTIYKYIRHLLCSWRTLKTNYNIQIVPQQPASAFAKFIKIYHTEIITLWKMKTGLGTMNLSLLRKQTWIMFLKTLGHIRQCRPKAKWLCEGDHDRRLLANTYWLLMLHLWYQALQV